MTAIKLNICDFWKSANDPETNFFVQFLRRYFDIQISDDPDFIIYSCFGKQFLNYDCTRIYYTPENIRPNFTECDFAFTFDFSDDPRNFRLPLYILSAMDFQDDLGVLIRRNRDVEQIASYKMRFCSFIYSNGKSKFRQKVFHKLNQYKEVEAPGRVNNNSNALRILDEKYKNERHPWRLAKLAFLKSSKFDIAFENESYPGYQSEKILDSFISDAIPIYWGNPMVDKYFNEKAFINVHHFKNLNELIKKIVDLDQDRNAYLRMLSEPIFKNNIIPYELSINAIVERFRNIFSHNGMPVAQRNGRIARSRSYIYHNYGKYAEKAFNRMINRTKNFS